MAFFFTSVTFQFIHVFSSELPGDDDVPQNDDDPPADLTIDYDDPDPPGDGKDPLPGDADSKNPPGDDGNNPSGDDGGGPSGNNPPDDVGGDLPDDDEDTDNDKGKKCVISDPVEYDFVLTDDEEIDFRQRVEAVAENSKAWLDTVDGRSYYGHVNLLFTDPPWGVLYDKDGLRSDDQLFHSDIPRYSDHISKLLTPDGTVLVRTSIQDWMLWADALDKAHLSVEKVPIVMVKHPNACAYVQARWTGRTSSCFFYVVAHKSARNYVWTRPKSGFIPANIYPPCSNVIIGIMPPKKKDRLLDHNGEPIRPQVCVSVFVQ